MPEAMTPSATKGLTARPGARSRSLFLLAAAVWAAGALCLAMSVSAEEVAAGRQDIASTVEPPGSESVAGDASRPLVLVSDDKAYAAIVIAGGAGEKTSQAAFDAVNKIAGKNLNQNL